MAIALTKREAEALVEQINTNIPHVDLPITNAEQVSKCLDLLREVTDRLLNDET